MAATIVGITIITSSHLDFILQCIIIYIFPERTTVELYLHSGFKNGDVGIMLEKNAD